MIIFSKNQQGIAIIKLLFLIPLVLIGLVVLFYIYTELNKAYWDYQVKQMCEKDGGVIIYETMELSISEYPDLMDSRGVLMIPLKNNAKEIDPFFIVYKSTKLHDGLLSIHKYEHLIIRSSDNKELSKLVAYGRKGGDFPDGISHPSSFSCGNEEKNILHFQSAISIKGE